MGCTPCAKRAAARRARTYDPATATTTRRGATDGQVFSLVLRDGRVERFGSRLEADAANARAGYTGTVRQGVS